MRQGVFWTAPGAILSVLGVVLIVLAAEAQQRYSACETSVPHVPCPMADFGPALLGGTLLVLSGISMIVFGFLPRATASTRPGPSP